MMIAEDDFSHEQVMKGTLQRFRMFKNIFLLGEYAPDPCPGKAPFPNFEYLNIFSPSCPWQMQ